MVTRRWRRAEAAGSAGVPEAAAAAAEVGAAGPKADRDIGNRMGSALVGKTRESPRATGLTPG